MIDTTADRAVTFHRTQNRKWLGNGFGHEPAHYAIHRGGVPIGTILPNVTYGWTATINYGDGPEPQVKLRNDKLNRLKGEVTTHIIRRFRHPRG